ncbi:MAG: response regulator [Bacteroidota bacterium]|nr:response regulator [Bacteroidota bacterium]
MKILLVEDDEDKRDDLSLFIIEKLTDDFRIAKSIQSGKKALQEEKYDLILLDMTIPTFDVSPLEQGGRTQPFGGRMLLAQMVRNRVETKVVVVTQFDLFGKGEAEITLQELDNQLKNSFPKIYCGAIHFSVSITGWKDLLYKKINNLINS